jgi:hypothetical protein
VEQRTEASPLWLSCPRCDGAAGNESCPTCRGWGRYRLLGCPIEQVLPESWEVIRLARFAEKGLLPRQGGVLDQSAWLMRAFEVVWGETEKWKQRLGGD